MLSSWAYQLLSLPPDRKLSFFTTLLGRLFELHAAASSHAQPCCLYFSRLLFSTQQIPDYIAKQDALRAKGVRDHRHTLMKLVLLCFEYFN